MSKRKPKVLDKTSSKRFCDLPWCPRCSPKLYPLRLFGAQLQVCQAHREIYSDNSEALWRRLGEGWKGIA